jgi:hypothetical protein
MISRAGIIANNTNLKPNNLPNLAAWYKMDSGITLVGGNVDVWADQSGNSLNFSAASGSVRPFYDSTNGLLFDGINDALSSGSSGLIGTTTEITFYFVLKPTQSQSSRVIEFNSGTRDWIYQLNTDLTQQATIVASPSVVEAFPSYVANQNQIVSFYAKQSDFVEGFKNGISNGATALGTLAGAATDLRFSIGSARTLTSLFYKGYIQEIIVYSVKHTVDERSQVLRYLGNRYNIDNY